MTLGTYNTWVFWNAKFVVFQVRALPNNEETTPIGTRRPIRARAIKQKVRNYVDEIFSGSISPVYKYY